MSVTRFQFSGPLLKLTTESSHNLLFEISIQFRDKRLSPRFLTPRPFPLEEVVLPDRARMALRDPRWLGAADHSYPAFQDGIW